MKCSFANSVVLCELRVPIRSAATSMNFVSDLHANRSTEDAKVHGLSYI
jgi:hypothetical protein